MFEFLIKSSSCVIPGYLDSEFGELISSETILKNIRIQPEKEQSPLPLNFISEKVGIESVAFFNTTADFVKSNWKNESDLKSIFGKCQSTQNLGLYSARIKAVEKCTDRLRSIDASFKMDSIAAHIHISGPFSPALEYELFEMRKSIGIGQNEPMQTAIFQQGCSGLFTALSFAKRLLKTYPNGSNILITAEQNMLIYAHDRCNRNAEESNINNWLWNAIFGEGVGAIVVGTPGKADETSTTKKVFFRVDSMDVAVAEPESRVTHCWNTAENTTSVNIKAREVRQTYIKHISKNAAAGIEKCGGLDDIFKVCLHESNPMLIEKIKHDLRIPSELVPTISNKVGTLACVSSFSLLDIAMNEFHSKNIESLSLIKRNKIVMALIGEAAGNIVAGNLCLSAQEY